jgi:hypothetical protein
VEDLGNRFEEGIVIRSLEMGKAEGIIAVRRAAKPQMPVGAMRPWRKPSFV